MKHVQDISSFDSSVSSLGRVAFPEYSGSRVQLMPFVWGDASSLGKELEPYSSIVNHLCSFIPTEGIGYVTIDEAYVPPMETHRRPGMHVDGVAFDGSLDFCGGGGFCAAGKSGLILASTTGHCKGWNQKFLGAPSAPDGDCEHLRSQAKKESEVSFAPNFAYRLDALSVHEVLPMTGGGRRQFIRLSAPNNGWWFEGYTKNPKGIQPSGKIGPKREVQMSFRGVST